MATARNDKEDKWIRCDRCGRKLGRKVGVWSDMKYLPAIEIKCHSCKTINYIMIGGQSNERT